MLYTGETVNSNELVLSSADSGAVANVPAATELATVRQLMESMMARMDELQQNQAVQLAGVHDRLDAVELELPLIQEQGALRMRDMEARISVEIDQAAQSAVEEATAAAAAVLQEAVAGKFSSLAAQMEAQRTELHQMRESKMQADSRLNRAILDIERLCGNLTPLPQEGSPRTLVEQTASPFRSRINEHIRKAAIDMAPGEANPLHNDAPIKKVAMEPVKPAEPLEPLPAPAAVAYVPPPLPVKVTPLNTVPGFDAWKRQFMQDGEPLSPGVEADGGQAPAAVTCPRCYSCRTRPATLNRLDYILRLANFTPHRCRSCSHRFYSRKVSPEALDDGHAVTRTPDAMETR